MQLPTVNIIQKDVSSFILQRLSSRPDPDQPSPPPLPPSSWDWQGLKQIKGVPDLTATTLASRTKQVQHHHHQQVQQQPAITVL